MKKLFMLLLIAFIACNSVKTKKENNHFITNEMSKDNIKSKTTVVLKVNAKEVDCYGAHGKQKCLQIKELGVDKEWQNQYEGIEEFTFVSGFVYNLQVEKIVLKNPPQDVGDTFYKLIKVVKKERSITDKELLSYETLIVTKVKDGRDGFTATLKDNKGGLYTSTISIPNLDDNYVRLIVGNKVKIAGEYAESYPVQIFAKKIKVLEKEISDYATLTVTKIENGKDGYTATLKNDKGNVFVCTISIPNLGDKYVRLKTGDKVKISGDYIDSFPTRIFAKQILKIE